MIRALVVRFTAIVCVGVPSLVSAQDFPDPTMVIASQREAISALSFLDGAWRGSAWTLLPSGERHTFVQTERVGPFLDGSVRVIEGRGYEDDGSVIFNAFAIVSYDLSERAYRMRSYAQGYTGDYHFTPTADGFVWEIPAGNMTMRFTAVIRDGEWHEIGERVLPGQEPIRFLEMNLRRVGDTEWPAGSPIGPS
jgi:hypothetical protein